jgi:GxxExxY protein
VQCFDSTVDRGTFDLRAMRRHRLVHRALTQSVIGAFYEVYNTLGFGFLEHVYILALERELRSRGHQVRREAGVCVMYKGEELAYQRLDMLVDDVLIVEVKSTVELRKGANRQIYNYLRATNLEVGLLLHFGPEPKFYRSYHPKHIPAHPWHPINPNTPSSEKPA